MRLLEELTQLYHVRTVSISDVNCESILGVKSGYIRCEGCFIRCEEWLEWLDLIKKL